MEKKYVLTDVTKSVCKRTLYQIRAIKDFGEVVKGDLGGWVEKEENLSQEGNCWILNDATVYDNAKVYGSAKVYGHAKIYGQAKVCGHTSIGGLAQIFGNSYVHGHARINDYARVYGCAVVYDNASIHGNAKVSGFAMVHNDANVYGSARISSMAEIYGNAQICDAAWIYGRAKIYDDALIGGVTNICDNVKIFGNVYMRISILLHCNLKLSSSKDFLIVGPIGSRNSYTIFSNNGNPESGIYVCCGCFYGTIDEFEQKVKQTHGTTPFAKEYLKAIELAKTMLS